MALGFHPIILASLQRLADPNYPGTKITASGFLGALIRNTPDLRPSLVTMSSGDSFAPSGMQLNTLNGQIREVKLKYLPRILPSQVGDVDDCATDFVFQYKESSIYAPFYKQVAFFLDWNFVERYEADAAQSINIGKPAYGAVKELETQILHALNGLVGAIDTTLLNTVDWGINPVTGNDSATTININQAANTLDLNDGYIRILADAQANEVSDGLFLVGNGLMNNFMIGRATGAIGMNQAGFNQSAAFNGVDWSFDRWSVPAWGANAVGAFAKGTIGFVDLQKWIGWKTGRFGDSWFMQGMYPIATPASAGANVPQTNMSFNIQIIENDCPEASVPTGYGAETYTAGRGWKVLISKNFGLWQLPSDSYQPTDHLFGSNGAFRYTITNECDGCE